MIDDIDTKLTTLLDHLTRDAPDTDSSNEFEKLNQFKKDIIYRTIASGHKMIETFLKTIDIEQKKFFFKTNSNEQSTQT